MMTRHTGASPMEVPVPTQQPMPSVRVLLNQLIDYAGLFPPAKLDMQTTVNNYARDIASEHGWLLGRIIVPAARLDEFESCATDVLPRDLDDDEPWSLSVLTAPAGDDAFEADLDRIHAFNDAHADAENGLATIDMIELKGSSIPAIESALDAVPDELFPFFEVAVDNDPRGLIASLAGSDAGAKIRTGGVTADLHPSVADVARFVRACALASVPMKATAGLHQPMRHFAELVKTDQFGFLNIFLAAIFAHAHDIDEQTVAELLDARDPSAISFSADEISWNGHSVDVDAIDDARLMFAVSFGSCSIDEPADALRAMNLI